jgi:hypothetical protein
LRVWADRNGIKIGRCTIERLEVPQEASTRGAVGFQLDTLKCWIGEATFVASL